MSKFTVHYLPENAPNRKAYSYPRYMNNGVVLYKGKNEIEPASYNSLCSDSQYERLRKEGVLIDLVKGDQMPSAKETKTKTATTTKKTATATAEK